MDSQLASVLTSGSLEVQNGSRRGEGSGAVTGAASDPKDETSPGTKPANLRSCLVEAAVTIRHDAQSINGKKPEVGGTCEPASQETGKTGGFGQPIAAKPGVPAPRRQPVRIKIVVPPGRKKPIANSAISPTKECAAGRTSGPDPVPAGAPVAGQASAAGHEGDVGDGGASQEADTGSLQEAAGTDGDVLGVGADVVRTPSRRRVGGDAAGGGEAERNGPRTRQNTVSDETEEQTEPLDLSLPRKRECRERGHGRLAGDPACESPLIMEVDEYEGDGDRDMVEEDNNEPLLSPSFFSTSVLASLSSVDCDTDSVLLIDDQGIPYTLSPDGLKVPQVDASSPDAPRTDPETPAAQEETSSAEPSFSQSSDRVPNAPPGESYPSPADEAPSDDNDQIQAAEIFTRFLMNPDPPEPNANAAQEAPGVPPPPPGFALPAQPVQILANPPSHAPLLLLSSSSSPGASTPVLLLLSSVPSSSPDDRSSTSAAFAVLDASTSRLSQVVAAAAPFPLPLSPGLGPPPPVLRLSPGSSPLVLSGASDATPRAVLAPLAVPPSALRDSRLGAALQAQISSSESKPGSEAIPAEESETKKPSTRGATPPQPQPAALPASQAEAQSPAPEAKRDSSPPHPERFPLDDHLYSSHPAAPPSPPVGPLLPSARLDPLEALDPLSPEESPASLGARRVLCCQLCPRIFFYLSDLERHAITHSQKKPHVCQQCGKAFKRSSHLQRHKHIHTGQRNFVCPICSKRFREAGELQRHQRVHTGEKPYQCQLCHTRFAERNTLRRHTKRKHPYHQVAMEMLNERRGRGGGDDDGGRGGVGAAQDEEESAEWYSSAVSTLDNSESEAES
ncbi:actin cytoskeleton-regulatory complex protein PAN1 [Kryptolebias marmoratus]|uniref:actin cytoskeleton-regulatory complex protein PAN1 n=1 Tax=Kryptolebias marmoratus TaxID=37003 RepID=UPI000D52FB61|nr:actin cytoskeleton-regulatory complex protein PAN1 [Kryptolebias marmoratus]